MTRFYFRENGTAPSGTFAFDAGWNETGSPAAVKPMFDSQDATDTLTTITGFTTATPGNERLHRQWISEGMAAGILFDDGVTTFKAQAQFQESALNDNAYCFSSLRVFSEDGSTVRATLMAFAAQHGVVEFLNTAVRNIRIMDGDVMNGGSDYTTVAGDRLVLEVGHDDSGGASISCSSRWGSDSDGTGDLGENDTDTTTTLRPWFETSNTITFDAGTPASLIWQPARPSLYSR